MESMKPQTSPQWSCSEYFDAAMTEAFPTRKSSVRILDAGAGQGYTGSRLCSLGYTNMDALTISKERLRRAEQSGIYRNLLFTALKAESTLFATGAFDAVICADDLFPDEVDPDALDEMLRLVKPGGIVCFTMNATQFDSEQNGFRLKCEELVTNGNWKLLSQGLTSPWDRHKDNNRAPLPGDSYVFVFMVLDNYKRG